MQTLESVQVTHIVSAFHPFGLTPHKALYGYMMCTLRFSCIHLILQYSPQLHLTPQVLEQTKYAKCTCLMVFRMFYFSLLNFILIVQNIYEKIFKKKNAEYIMFVCLLVTVFLQSRFTKTLLFMKEHQHYLQEGYASCHPQISLGPATEDGSFN